MLSVDQFLRLISVPAVVVAFLIASQVSGAVGSHSASIQLASD
jgi:H+/gluconate symporter-like permease